MADTPSAQLAIVVLDPDDLELIEVVIENELASDPEHFALSPGDLDAERKAREQFHPRLRDLLAQLQSARQASSGGLSSPADERPTVGMFDQDAPAGGYAK